MGTEWLEPVNHGFLFSQKNPFFSTRTRNTHILQLNSFGHFNNFSSPPRPPPLLGPVQNRRQWMRERDEGGREFGVTQFGESELKKEKRGMAWNTSFPNDLPNF